MDTPDLNNSTERIASLVQNTGKRLQAARKSAGLSQTQLAQQLGLDQTTISFYETGTIDIPLSRLYQLASALRISAESLLVTSADAGTAPLSNDMIGQMKVHELQRLIRTTLEEVLVATDAAMSFSRRQSPASDSSEIPSAQTSDKAA
jgi:HTH-type transcriptional regulator/antitoxin HipB